MGAHPQPLTFWRSPETQHRTQAGVAAPNDTHPLHTPERYANRRDFLRAAGFSIASATAAACSRVPAEQAIPMLVQPEGQVPGRASFYTSVCTECNAGCGLIIKTVDGRPVKLEGNPAHPLSRGGLCALGQAALLGLYDSHRFAAPMQGPQPASWADVDAAIQARLATIQTRGGRVRVLTGPILSPTLRASIARFVQSLPDARHVVYDPLSSSALLEAHAVTHGVRAAPRVHLERAEVIVALDADFLGTWVAPVPFSAAYAEGRALERSPRRLSYHAQIESRMSLTGTRADRRIRVAPDELRLVAQALGFRVALLAGERGVPAPALPAALAREVEALAERLWQHRERSVVLCDVQDVAAQVACNATNHRLGAYEAVLDLAYPSHQVQGSDRDLAALLVEIDAQQVDALFVLGVNPLFDLPLSPATTAALARIPLVVALAERPNETTAAATHVCPVPHPIEAWGDAEPVAGIVTVQQPAIASLGQTRPAAESFGVWAGAPADARELVRAYWEAHVFPRQSEFATFAALWDHALRAGVVDVTPERLAVHAFAGASVGPMVVPLPPPGTLALVLYPKIGIRDGRSAYNAWLQELPDPVTKVTWDNYACLSVATARRLDVRDGDMVRMTTAGGPDGKTVTLELPVYVQPGQHDAMVAVALGYGSAMSARFAGLGPTWTDARPTVGANGRVGMNAAPLLALSDGVLSRTARHVRVERAAASADLASTQTHFSITAAAHLGMRPADDAAPIRELTLAAIEASGQTTHREPAHPDLWPADHPYPGHRWGLVVDLAACTGCSACIVACQAENNTPVVGKDEVRRSREMHWLRLDRYYTGEDDDVRVAVQPMLCQQCENAPCETVCPVAASVHDSEGLNVQVYNRCVGTRFCENNCPYKVRRFNWFDYARPDLRQNLTLNPSVTVRSRGVMEKCTFCVQRIQEAKLEARRLGRPLADGEIQTACEQSCPSRAIVFGDANDPASRVVQLRASARYYRVLEELNVKPSVGYLAVVRHDET